MFSTLFVKKRVTHEMLASNFVNKTLRSVDETYNDFLDAIYNDTELISFPKLDYKDPTELMYLIVAGNMMFFERILSSQEENTICNSIIEQMCIVFDMKFNQMQDKLG